MAPLSRVSGESGFFSLSQQRLTTSLPLLSDTGLGDLFKSLFIVSVTRQSPRKGRNCGYQRSVLVEVEVQATGYEGHSPLSEATVFDIRVSAGLRWRF